MMRWKLGILGVMVVCGTAAEVAAAPIAVLESYAGERPKDAAVLLAPVLDELGRLGYASAPELRRRADTRMSRPGDLGAVPAELAVELTTNGYDAWLDGRIEEAATRMEKAVRLFQFNPAAFATATERRTELMKALVILSLARKRLGKIEESSRAMAELVRSFPDMPLDHRLYGPEASALYRAVAKDVAALRRGRLRVEASDDAVALFVNERFTGAGTAFDEELPPGVYRVYAQKGAVAGRLHTVEVSPGATVTLRIEWDLDAAVRTRDFIGLVFEDESSRSRLESQLAISVAQKLGLGGVVVLGIREHEGRRAITGTLLSIDTGRALRAAAVVVEPTLPAEDTLRGLARFLAGGKLVPGLIVPSTSADAVAPPGRSADRRTRSTTWKWLALGTGLAAAGTGVWLIHLDGPILDDQGNHTADQYETKGLGIGAIAAGAALIGTGILLWVREPSSERPRAVGLVPTHRGLAVTLRGTF